MIYPGTQSGFLNGTGDESDNKKKLVDMLSRRMQAAPLFGGGGRGSSDLPQVGAPPIGYNPFLAMLAGRPGETFNDLPPGISDALASGVQNGPGPVQGGGSPNDPGYSGYDGNVNTPAPSPSPDPSGGMGYGHYFPGSPQNAAYHPTTQPPSLSAFGGNPSSIPPDYTTNPAYHQLLQMALLGLDR